MNSRISEFKTSTGIVSLALFASVNLLSAAEWNYTVNADSTYSTQQNSVTAGNIIINGAWVSNKRAVANTQEKSAAYGKVYVEVGAYSENAGIKNGYMNISGDDIFKFSDFTGSQTSLNSVFFELNNKGVINYTGAGRVIDAAAVSKGALKLTNALGASITIASTSTGKGDVIKTAGQLIFENRGTISTNTTGSYGGQVLDLADSSNSLTSTVLNTNTGSMKSAGNEVISGGNNLSVSNYGLMQTTAADTSAIKLKPATLNAVNSFTLQNGSAADYASAVILGTKHGVTGVVNADITNYGRIEGGGGSAINWDWGTGENEDESVAVNVTNYGTLKGYTANYVDGDGDGVDIDYVGSVTNYGTIQANNSSVSADGIAMGGGTITNAASGVITASNANGSGAYGVLIDDSNGQNAYASASVVNYGVIEGKGANSVGIKFISDKQNTIVNGGTIRGEGGNAVEFGGGGDTLTIKGGSIEGAIVGGGGSDTVVVDLEGASSYNLSNDISAIEKLILKNGSVEISGSLGFDVTANNASSALIDIASGVTYDFLASCVVNFDLTGIADLSAFSEFAFIEFDEFPSVIDLDSFNYTVWVSGVDVSQDWELISDGQSLYLSSSNVPEPAACALVCGALALCFCAYRKRRR